MSGDPDVLEQLKKDVCDANRDLQRLGLVTLTWGNVSGLVRSEGFLVIKPSGVGYDTLKPADMVVMDLNGRVVEGDLRPSSDAPTHIALYRNFETIAGITHTHSTYATMFAQACREIPCLGTTHADHFAGPVPVTRFLKKEEVETDYEANTGMVIVERLGSQDPLSLPAVLVAGHAPFAFGNSPADSVRNALILERVAHMAIGTLQLNPALPPLPDYILQKHYRRKHGPDAYYGQKERGRSTQ
jgi:L-ribulose-5-phosphate 4-epimerase